MRSQAIEGAILVVEDTEPSASMLEVALAGIGGRCVLVASTGDEALRMLAREGRRLQAVVTDLNMPGMDGFELIRRLRAERICSRLPVVVVSGNTDPDAPSRAIGAGADAYFAKPFSPAQVRQKLEQLLNDEPTS